MDDGNTMDLIHLDFSKDLIHKSYSKINANGFGYTSRWNEILAGDPQIKDNDALKGIVFKGEISLPEISSQLCPI